MIHTCGAHTNGLPVHVWPAGACVGDACLCGQRILDLLGATYLAQAYLERTAD